ncbi:4Fe-4S binding protein [Tepidibacter thalassicus]|uniref:4Fe-4S binding domain-containing protein n=1 Tax=Tepidibacter thalassicus DSM 15285 TaxID=1123350 RepID=A0A1M5TQP2_9FIRM|nr:4Fe-4S dicluster domain-containing protein [Tepidibacter thalassicus]SHH53087.1 4Fe-4S binding domain-containing protein [Tepidibacter thalassicus DSM 15285]
MKNKYFNITKENFKWPSILIIIFLSIGLWRYFDTKNFFYVINFGYIGISLSLGTFLGDSLKKEYSQWGRRITQLLVGLYMLVFLGLIGKENMQIEGFFFYLLMGVFAGASLHYAIAKIFGPIVFGRGWCGWACWTAMVLDLLPWKKPQNGRIKYLGIVRYFIFIFSLFLVMYILVKNKNMQDVISTQIYWLVVGNIIYYLIGIILSLILKDNRAFCKYVCPIPVMQKIPAIVSLLKVEIEKDKCIDCKLCEKNCPMDIKLIDYKNENKRILSTECILCKTCINVCPKKAIRVTKGFDFAFKEKLNYANRTV